MGFFFEEFHAQLNFFIFEHPWTWTFVKNEDHGQSITQKALQQLVVEAAKKTFHSMFLFQKNVFGRFLESNSKKTKVESRI